MVYNNNEHKVMVSYYKDKNVWLKTLDTSNPNNLSWDTNYGIPIGAAERVGGTSIACDENCSGRTMISFNTPDSSSNKSYNDLEVCVRE